MYLVEREYENLMMPQHREDTITTPNDGMVLFSVRTKAIAWRFQLER